jgi:hypothetical protein
VKAQLHSRYLLACAAGLPCSLAGMNKIVINHLDKMFVTSDASTIVSELDVYHPAAKLLAMAARAQEQEVGDGTNLVRIVVGYAASTTSMIGAWKQSFNDWCMEAILQ